MDGLSRRSFIKRLTTISVGGALAARSFGSANRSSSPHGEGNIEINVVLHGLFVLNLTDTGVQLLTPYVEEHIYKAGSWSFPSVEDLHSGETYRLAGVDRNPAPEIDRECSIVLSQSKARFQVKPEKSHLIVDLPFPKKIRFLRCLQGHDLFNGPSGSLIHSNGISLCPVLIYESPDYDQVKLSGTAWKPWVQPETRSANLHFWAEPPKNLDPMHASRAYATLMELIPPLQFGLTTNAKPPLDKETGVRGLPSFEEMGWSEWANPGEGGYPTNCCALVVTQ